MRLIDRLDRLHGMGTRGAADGTWVAFDVLARSRYPKLREVALAAQATFKLNMTDLEELAAERRLVEALQALDTPLTKESEDSLKEGTE